MSVEGKAVIVVQAKASRVGMYLLGQAHFSRLLVEKLGAASVRTVALCTMDDAVLRPLAEQHGIEIVVMPEFRTTASRWPKDKRYRPDRKFLRKKIELAVAWP